MSSKSLFLCFTTCLILFSMNVFGTEATEFLVGGNKNSWHIHTSPNELNEWAEKERFRIGDSLGNSFSFVFSIQKSIVISNIW